MTEPYLDSASKKAEIADWPGARLAPLREWLQRNISGLEGPIELLKFAGGQSNPTYKITTADDQYVLRRRPHGLLLDSAHAIDREYHLLECLYPTHVPVPRPLAFCDDPQVAGTSFYVMALVDGRNFSDGTLPQVLEQDRREVYASSVRTLANLHAIDPSEVGLNDFGKPGNYFARQLARWTRQYRASETDIIPAMERLIAWLPKHIPAQSRTSIVHGDYRIDNLLFDNKLPFVTAVLDWELATIGDPLADVMNVAMNWILPADGRSGLAGVDLQSCHLPAMTDILTMYCQASDQSHVPSVEWYFAFGLFRLASIIQGVKRRSIDGNASSNRAASAIALLLPLTELAISYTEERL